jgi:hypothetical protein
LTGESTYVAAMADHKQQHYVPRCHLKPFSARGDGKAINLLNIASGRLIRNAPLKNQCVKNYFYGDDLAVERGLQAPEGRYASIVKEIVSEITVEYASVEFLRDFCYLQYLRTDVAARRTLLAHQDMENLVFEREPNDTRPPPITQEQVIRDAIATFFDTVQTISDLKVCIIRNDTRAPFVTSDDPAVMINRFYAQRLGPRWNSFGIASAGLMLVLPLSPAYLMCAYDGDVYTCPDKTKNIVPLKKEEDATALNTLQFLKAAENIYFSDTSEGDLIKSQFDRVASRRPKSWHNVHFAIRDDDQSHQGSTRYRVVHTEAERFSTDEALIHLQNRMLYPSV